jgi:hypothetical protein
MWPKETAATCPVAMPNSWTRHGASRDSPGRGSDHVQQHQQHDDDQRHAQKPEDDRHLSSPKELLMQQG